MWPSVVGKASRWVAELILDEQGREIIYGLSF